MNLQGDSDISSMRQHSDIAGEIDRGQLAALKRWNIANRDRNPANASGEMSLVSYLRYQTGRFRHRLMRLDPKAREAVAVLWRQLGREAVEALFGRPLLTLDAAALNEITRSRFWRNVLLPLDRPTGIQPLFDPDFYFRQPPGIELNQLTPLAHYILVGAGEGRSPHPLFHTLWYLARNPDVAASGTNPLLHFVDQGGAEGRSPHPGVPGAWYTSTYERPREAHPVDQTGATPIAQRRYRVQESKGQEVGGPVAKRPIICVSHVLPSQPRAGNQYRISRLLSWFASRGHDLLVIVAPEDADEPDAAARQAFFAQYPNGVICCRDATVFASCNTLRFSLDFLHERRVGDIVGKRAPKVDEPLTILESSFCHDALIGVLTAISRQVPNPVYYINYGFMTRFIPYLSGVPISLVDTHDVLSDKSAKVTAFGISDSVAVSPAEEQRMLRHAEAIIAIHSDDATKLSALDANKLVLTAGVDFAVPDIGAPPDQPTILVIAHNNPINLRGVQDFLRFAWPLIKLAEPEAQFIVVGSVSESVQYPDPQVHFVGMADDLTPYYRTARVVINPSVAGTGLKIKTVESIAYLRPVVAFPHGVDGIAGPLVRMCHIASDWYEFAGEVIRLLQSDSDALPNSAERDAIKDHLAPGTVYRELDAWLAGHDQPAAS
jgi:hypothetical protein